MPITPDFNNIVVYNDEEVVTSGNFTMFSDSGTGSYSETREVTLTIDQLLKCGSKIKIYYGFAGLSWNYSATNSGNCTYAIAKSGGSGSSTLISTTTLASSSTGTSLESSDDRRNQVDTYVEYTLTSTDKESGITLTCTFTHNGASNSANNSLIWCYKFIIANKI
jgi:hypothetical protein